MGVPLALVLARLQFTGRGLLRTLVLLPLVLPPTVLGYYLLVTLGQQGFGPWIEATLGFRFVFSWTGAVVAATISALPLVVQTARVGLDQARRVVQDLRPDLLEQGSLPDAINRAAARWQPESGLEVRTSVTGVPVPLPPDIEVTLLRAAQEALINVRKHARATEVQLTLSYMPDTVILDVQDNGVGLAGAEPSPLSGGYGLQAMRERAALRGVSEGDVSVLAQHPPPPGARGQKERLGGGSKRGDAANAASRWPRSTSCLTST